MQGVEACPCTKGEKKKQQGKSFFSETWLLDIFYDSEAVQISQLNVF